MMGKIIDVICKKYVKTSLTGNESVWKKKMRKADVFLRETLKKHRPMASQVLISLNIVAGNELAFFLF
jgi:hypothetical protein